MIKIKQNKFRKTLLTLGSFAAVATPVAAVVSCGDHVELRKDIILGDRDVRSSVRYFNLDQSIQVDAPAWSDESARLLVPDVENPGYYKLPAYAWLTSQSTASSINRKLYNDIRDTAKYLAREIITNPSFKGIKKITGAEISVKRTGQINYKIKLGAFREHPRSTPFLSPGDLFNQPFKDQELREFSLNKLAWGIEFRMASQWNAVQKWQDILAGRLSILSRQR